MISGRKSVGFLGKKNVWNNPTRSTGKILRDIPEGALIGILGRTHEEEPVETTGEITQEALKTIPGKTLKNKQEKL